jgi:hypothetical protein
MMYGTPPGYQSLETAINAVGQELFGTNWAGDGWHRARAITNADQARQREIEEIPARKAEAARARRAAGTAIGRNESDSYTRAASVRSASAAVDADEVARARSSIALLSVQRRAAITELQRRFYGAPPDHSDALSASVLLTDGRFWPIAPAYWYSAVAEATFEDGRAKFRAEIYGPESGLIDGPVMVAVYKSNDAPPRPDSGARVVPSKTTAEIDDAAAGIGKTNSPDDKDPSDHGEEAQQPERKTRRLSADQNVQEEAQLGNRIRSVIEAAKQKWSDPSKAPSPALIARALVTGKSDRKLHGFKAGTIKKILEGSYPAAKRRSIESPFATGIDT